MSGGKFKTRFNNEWQTDPAFESWLQPVPDDPHRARCSLCSKTFDLSNMGRQAIVSHKSGAKHQRSSLTLTNQQPTLTHFRIVPKNEGTPSDQPTPAGTASVEPSAPPVASSSTTVGQGQATAALQKRSALSSFLGNDAVTRAEVLWALQIIAKHQSYRSCDKLKELFQVMFSDSEIAGKFTLSPTKASYVIVYGLAPYFRSALEDVLKTCTSYVACFDEALNKVSQRGQMDIVVRFWDPSTNAVATRYLTSVFLGHATASDLEKKFKEGLGSLPLTKLMQISMDGPSVNLKFLDNMKSNLSDDQRKLIDIGSCGLHVLHGAFRTGHDKAGWAINDFLRAIYSLFKDSPARRADFTAITGSNRFAKKFCAVRWVENVDVASRALEVLPNVKKYLAENSKKLPTNATCKNIQLACSDPFICAKTHFFISVASVIEPFLRKYQTNSPMVPFMYSDLGSCVRTLMTRFVKKAVLSAADTVVKLSKVDVTSKENLCSYKDVDIGVAAKAEMRHIKASDREHMQFRMECIQFLSAMTAKILERSPLKYPFVRFASALAPVSVMLGTTSTQENFRRLVETLYEANCVTAQTADSAKVQFTDLCTSASNEQEPLFKNFSASDDKLDAFYFEVLGDRTEFSALWHVVKLILIVSHGNAAVESGFSINNDMLVENLLEESLIGQRTVYDAIQKAGGLLSVNIDKRMLQSVRAARSRWEEALRKSAADEDREKSAAAGKRKAAEHIKTLETKKAKLVSASAAAAAEIDQEIILLKKQQ